MSWLSDLLDLQQLLTQLVAFLPKALTALGIFIGFLLLYRVSRHPLHTLLNRSSIDTVLVDMLVEKVYRITLLVLGLVMGASQLGINVGAALAGLGVAGVAIGFAAKDILANVIAGFTIFIDEPFLSGDWVHVAGEYGRVEEVTLRSTRLKTRQNTYVVLPNKQVVNEVLINDSKHGRMRLDIPVGIAYKEDISAAREALVSAAASVEGVLADPRPDVVVKELGGSSVDLLVRAWIGDAQEAAPVGARLVEAAKTSLDAAGIEIPFPHLQLFLDTVEERAARQLARIPALGVRGGD